MPATITSEGVLVQPDERGYAYVDHEREVNTYAHLWHASRCVLEKGLSERKGCAWQFLSSLVLSMFAFEAYMNHVGDAYIENWDDLERRRPMEKLRHLCLTFKIDLGAKGERPLQTLNDLIKLRNELAHGHSVTLKPKPTLLAYNDPNFDSQLSEEPVTQWEARIRSADFAARVREDLETVFKAIHARLPDREMPLFHFGFHTSGSRHVGK
ncbi:MAG: hypothetical protein KAG62_17455 [Caulobacter sp.]|nr:hypothetical protein [Caulobacter sp.]